MCKEELWRIPIYKSGERKVNEWNTEDSQKDRRWSRRVCDVGHQRETVPRRRRHGRSDSLETEQAWQETKSLDLQT